MSDIFYKIQDPVSKLFSTGGADPRWSRTGKVWKRRGDLSSHFTNLSRDGRQAYEKIGAVVVEIETVTRNPVPVVEYIQAANDRKTAREDERKRQIDDWQRKSELAELARLQAKYKGQA